MGQTLVTQELKRIQLIAIFKNRVGDDAGKLFRYLEND